mmetsp:Transcript_23652/g.59879  ORF Transcript_23652/g.59879 Transcript_23652/m.59879 type:complete len:207 (-) Transcript_23652:1802-2422(-)
MILLQRYSFSATSFSSWLILSRSSGLLSRVTSLNSSSLMRWIMASFALSNCSCAALSTCSALTWYSWCSAECLLCIAWISSCIRSSSACICLRNSTLRRSTFCAICTVSPRLCSLSASLLLSCACTVLICIMSSSILAEASALASRRASSLSFCHEDLACSVCRLCSSTSCRRSACLCVSCSCSLREMSVSYLWMRALLSSFCSAS